MIQCSRRGVGQAGRGSLASDRRAVVRKEPGRVTPSATGGCTRRCAQRPARSRSAAPDRPRAPTTAPAAADSSMRAEVPSRRSGERSPSAQSVRRSRRTRPASPSHQARRRQSVPAGNRHRAERPVELRQKQLGPACTWVRGPSRRASAEISLVRLRRVQRSTVQRSRLDPMIRGPRPRFDAVAAPIEVQPRRTSFRSGCPAASIQSSAATRPCSGAVAEVVSCQSQRREPQLRPSGPQFDSAKPAGPTIDRRARSPSGSRTMGHPRDIVRAANRRARSSSLVGRGQAERRRSSSLRSGGRCSSWPTGRRRAAGAKTGARPAPSDACGDRMRVGG